MTAQPPPPNAPIWGHGPWAGFPPLRADADADVCVVGLGGSGLSCIDELLRAAAEQGRTLRVVGLDARSVGAGAAGRNGGFLLAGTAAFYHRAIHLFGHARARRLYELTITQIDEMLESMPQAVRRTGSLRVASSPEELDDCAMQLAALRADGFPAEAYDGPEGRGLLVATDCSFDPLQRCRLLACHVSSRGAQLHEWTTVQRIAAGEVRCDGRRVRCDRIIVAVDGTLERLVPELASRVRTARLQMLATAPTREIDVPRPVYARWGYDYWQQLADGALVLGGFRDQGGDAEWTQDATPSPLVQEALEQFLRDNLRVRAAVTHRWAASVSYTTSGLPVLEELGPGVWVTGAYSGTGNVVGALCGRGAARLALGEPAEIEDLVRSG